MVSISPAPFAGNLATGTRTDDNIARKALSRFVDLHSATLTLEPVATAAHPAPPCGFLKRFIKAYADDWHPPASAENSAEPAYRGHPMTTALQTGKHGDWWKKANIQIYGWVDVGMNVSTSHHGPYANAPAAYAQVANSVILDQATFYIERVPDTIQTDHFDWGFRLGAE